MYDSVPEPRETSILFQSQDNENATVMPLGISLKLRSSCVGFLWEGHVIGWEREVCDNFAEESWGAEN